MTAASHAVSPNAVPALAEALNGVLADTYALYLKTKNFHWHVSGQRFRSLHLLFDEHAGELIGVTDDLAERVRKLGGRTLTSIGDISKKQSIKDNDADTVACNDMVAELAADNEAFAMRLRAAREVCDGANDFPSVALLDDMLDAAEKRIWFLRESTKA